MTYLQFHLVFLVPPIIVLGVLQRFGGVNSVKRVYSRIAVIAAIALVYTTPWDNYLIAIGAWSYPVDAVVGTIGLVPIEEYCFFILQPLATGLLFEVTRRKGISESAPRGSSTPGVLAGLAITGAGVAALTSGYSVYLGLILAWAGPVVVLQWFYNGRLLERTFKQWLAPLTVSTFYLWFADAIAIRLGIWRISEEHTSGLNAWGLPVEEMAFFLVTNAMVLFGLILLEGSGFRTFRREVAKIEHSR